MVKAKSLKNHIFYFPPSMRTYGNPFLEYLLDMPVTPFHGTVIILARETILLDSDISRKRLRLKPCKKFSTKGKDIKAANICISQIT